MWECDDILVELLESYWQHYVLYPFVEEEESEWYTCVISYIHSWRKKVQMIYVCLYLVLIHEGRRVRMVYMCDIRVNICVFYCVLGVVYVYVWYKCMHDMSVWHCVYQIYYPCMVMWTSKYRSIKVKWKDRHWLLIT